MLYYELPVYRDVCKLIPRIFEYTKEFPREYTYTVGQNMKREGVALVRAIYRGNKDRDKEPYLEKWLQSRKG